VSALQLDDAEHVARIHRAVLAEGFLARLSPRVLREIYAGAVTASGAIGLVARSGGDLGGFVLGTTDTRALFQHVLRRRGLVLGLVILGDVVRKPCLLRLVLESLRYPSRLHHASGGRVPELVAIGVLPEHRTQRVGSALVRALDAEFGRRGVRAYEVSAYASNLAAGAFYRRLGFQPSREFVMYGRSWAVYRRDLGEPDRSG
jgi:ribosomal protein S18 acetylase RimI-like enzyme